MIARLFRPTALKLALLIGATFASAHLAWKAASPRFFPFTALELLESKAIDVKFQLRGPVKSSGQVVVAAVDEASIRRYGLWPWRRPLVGQALKNLNDAGARAVAVDISFPDADRSSPHRVVNGILEELAALAGDDPASEPLLRLRKAALERRLKDPDDILAEHLGRSPTVVLGIGGLLGGDARAVNAATRERDERALDRFFLKELYDRDDRHPDQNGQLVQDWGPSFKERPEGLSARRIRSIEAVQGPLPVIAAAIHRAGSYDAEEDRDGTIRHYNLAWRLQGSLVPSLALSAAAAALDARPVALKSRVMDGALDGYGLMRGEGPDALRLFIPVDPWSGLILIRYPGARGASVEGKPLYDVLSLADVADGAFDPVRIKDKVVVVGTTAVGTFDQRVTPFDSFAPGLYTHAAVIDSILTRSFLVQPSSLVLVEAALLLALALAFGLAIPRLPTWGQVLMMIAAAGGYFALDGALFARGLALNTVTPLAEILALSFGLIFYGYVTADQEKRQVRAAFQYYLTKSVMEEMLRHPEKLKLGGDKRELTVLFSDIRGFTTISERLAPEELVRTLNEYLTPMTNLVFETEGTLDKYMGDALMAVWGAPLPQKDHALRACAAALRMLEELSKLRAQWRAQGRPDIDIGIGINSGPMAVGNMGSAMRFDYTVMGDNVNLGSRLEGTNKEYGTRIIISEHTYSLVRDRVTARELGSVRVKGKRQPVVIYELRAQGLPHGEEARTIGAFESGVAAYRSRAWDEAERCFRGVLEVWKDDGPSGHYLEDIADKRAHPPGDGWDGVYEMKTK